jgi:hypothetical protein
MLNPLDWFRNYALAGALIVAAGGLAWGGIQTYRIRGMQLEAAQALAKATQAAREKEQNWQSDAATVEEVHADELRKVTAARDRAIADSVRERSKRLPEAARSSCAGTTGRELSAADAEAFIRLAADADATRSDLAACRAWVEAVRR